MSDRLPLACCLLLLGAASVAAADESAPSYGTDVRPILAKNCITCHGPDELAREAGLRLDTREGATEDRGGYRAVVPGDAEASELIARVTAEDEAWRMPPAEAHPPLSEAEIETLRRWIDAGAKYQRHWSLVPPERPDIPDVQRDSWCRGPIDRFILRRIEQAGLEPSPPASREALIRRLYLDLAGITPSPEQVERFLRDDSPGAYRRAVDRLLASPEYAERFARPWLDLARYSDTNGYEKDRPRTIWPYRDWVIEALAADMPFDEFTVKQLAGDMLPGATRADRIATGFHRNTMLNEEGGIDPLEYRFYAMVDRVATTGTVWMGLTTGCAQCHTHKYDPITHTDYYALMALLNNADEPELVADSPETIAKRRRIEAKIREREDELAQRYLRAEPTDPQHRQIQADYRRWLSERTDEASRWTVLRPTELQSTMPKLEVTSSGSVLARGDVTKRDEYTLTLPPAEEGRAYTALRLEVLPHKSLPAGGPGMAFYEGRRGDFFLSELTAEHRGEPVPLRDATHSFGQISVGSGTAEAANVLDGEGSTGWSTSSQAGQENRLVVNFDQPFSPSEPWTIRLLFERHFAAPLGHFRISVTGRRGGATASPLGAELEAELSVARRGESKLDESAMARLQRHYVRHSEKLKEQRRPIERLRQSIPPEVRTLVMRQRPPEDHRVTRRHDRGEYLKAEEVVEPAVPGIFRPLPENEPANRLTFARWLVSKRNPLIGRVTVNRAWRQFFGTGIVRTAGDFGTQSEPPSHPDLLDWLAVELREGGWSMKRLHREIVLSATYRQRVGRAPESDPDHRLVTSMPHRRLEAERIRDALLSASGRITRRLGGPSVYPPQPESVMAIAYGSPQWKTSQGADRYRRSLYTFSKRTAPFAAYATFDAPTGELCVARRATSTTPLQALTLLNDPMYIELARGLAETVRRVAGEDAPPREIARRMFRRLLVRSPSDEELEAVTAFYHRQLERQSAEDSGSLDPWTLVARALINTDEAITIP